MTIQTVYSTQSDAVQAVKEVADQLGAFKPTAVIYFVSSDYDQTAIAKEMKSAFAEAAVIGCSTAGEIVSGHMFKGSCVVMAMDAASVAALHIEVVPRIGSENHIDTAFSNFEKKLGCPIATADISRYVGLILVDGLSGAEEKLMDTIGNLTDMTFIGGSAGDDLKFKQTWVHADGEVYSDAAILAVMQPTQGFDILKTQSFKVLDKTLTATKVDEAARTVVEFDNGMSAAEAYANALNVPVDKAAEHFMDHPLGLMVGDEPYVRSPQQIVDQKMVFYCGIKSGMELKVLETLDIVADTRQALADKVAELGSAPAGIINFHCILRTLELINKQQEAAYGALFADIPTVGFSTYGEEYIGHINQTSTMLLIK